MRHTTTTPTYCASQIKDKNGKDVVSLIEDLRQKMPLNLATIMQRLKLEEVRWDLPSVLGVHFGLRRGWLVIFPSSLLMSLAVIMQ